MKNGSFPMVLQALSLLDTYWNRLQVSHLNDSDTRYLKNFNIILWPRLLYPFDFIFIWLTLHLLLKYFVKLYWFNRIQHKYCMLCKICNLTTTYINAEEYTHVSYLKSRVILAFNVYNCTYYLFIYKYYSDI